MEYFAAPAPAAPEAVMLYMPEVGSEIICQAGAAEVAMAGLPKLKSGNQDAFEYEATQSSIVGP